jgi:hypothetical protein
MTTGATVLEIERFEWITPERIELVGYWSGLRGRRFVRPTLVLKGEGGQRRLLALLDHKPWAAHDGEAWTAAFAWEGEVVKFEGAVLSVGSGIDLELPSPRMRPGKPRRFRQRVVLRDALRDEQAAPTLASGIVSDSPEPEPKLSRAEALKAALPVKPKDEPEPTVALDPAPEGEPDAPAVEPDAPAVADAAQAEIDRIRREREALRRERDRALVKLRDARGELETERQARERAVADARAAERESANRMLGEGAELRASVERQREIAYLERDEAKDARDKAIAARNRACEERDAALAEAKDARRDRKEAFAQRDRAVKVSERAEAARAAALQERHDAVAERDTAVKERDEILRVHERGLPVHAPKPRFLPDEHEQRSELGVWGPRVSALGLLLLCALIVLRLFACG